MNKLVTPGGKRVDTFYLFITDDGSLATTINLQDVDLVGCVIDHMSSVSHLSPLIYFPMYRVSGTLYPWYCTSGSFFHIPPYPVSPFRRTSFPRTLVRNFLLRLRPSSSCLSKDPVSPSHSFEQVSYKSFGTLYPLPPSSKYDPFQS